MSKDQLLYTQMDMDTAKAQAELRGEGKQFFLNEEGDPDISKIKRVAELLNLSIEKYSDSFPHDAAVAAEFLETTLKMFIKAFP